jgi:hypothetical protein
VTYFTLKTNIRVLWEIGMEIYTLNLIYALKNREEEKAIHLLQQGAEEVIFDYRCSCCCNMAFLALKTNQINFFKELIFYLPDLNITDEHNDSLLMWSAKNNKIEAITMILDEMNKRDYVRRRKTELLLNYPQQYWQFNKMQNIRIKFNNIYFKDSHKF